MSKKRIVIVGAGFGGLTAAALLAKEGFNVTVLEKNNQAGGRARVWNKDGFRFDMGPSWYLMPEVFERFFAVFGRNAGEVLQLQELDPYYRVFFESGETADISGDLNKTKALFDGFEKGSGDSLDGYLRTAAFKYNTALNEFLYRDYPHIFSFFNGKLLANGLKLHMFSSLDKYVRRSFSDYRIRQILEYAMVFLGNSPDNAPGLYSIMSHVDLKLGVFYPRGGLGSVVEALINLNNELGVDIRLNSPVTAIKKGYGNDAVMVYCGEETFAADAAVANADYPHVEMDLLSTADRSYRGHYWKKKVLAPSMFLMYLGLNKRLPGLAHHNLYFTTDWNNHFRQIFENPSWPDNPCAYLCCPSVTDPTVAPKGKENLFILVPVAAGLADNMEIRNQQEEQALGLAERLAGETFRSDILIKRTFTIDDFITDYNAYQGTALSLAHTLNQTAVFRPRRRSRRIRDLYYSGQYTHPGVGVPMTFISSTILAEQLTKRYG